MFKKIRVVVTGVALVGIISVGLNSSFSQQANHGDVPAPARPDLAYNVGDGGAPSNSHGNTGGIVAQEI
ncbi:Phr family secreted Rap phosphatase inhibitor [Bacillus sp. TL12]|uniref:Phr family secreted Rap phosphatase inhibitor n=1 Tax=Bacillus sp. TL12 TaxID=2894756 RepID=UPI001F51FE7D|nr:Phr family secreted Rap phosphatase inhibitor [Bacillus sp. TL12]MCI0766824.1 Phr family secreted Rap phosphatase inhibitor [Bacillus sp. TL12]